MPNTTLAANAQSMPIDRRYALGFAAGAVLLGAPKLAKANSFDADRLPWRARRRRGRPISPPPMRFSTLRTIGMRIEADKAPVATALQAAERQ